MPQDTNVIVELINNKEDFAQAFHCVSEAFGRQAKDGVWLSTNPGWDTPEGQQFGANRLVERWQGVTKNKAGQPNTIFLKATVARPGSKAGERTIAGYAVWQQTSIVEGHGDPPPTGDLGSSVEALLPPADQRFARQMFKSLWKRRTEYVKEKATADPPAIFVLDMCAVDPAFQRRGIAGKLVQWGLDEAKRRGNLEATTEASSMGRAVYERLGFKPEGADIEYIVDAEFASRDKPPNVFMRTG